MAGRKAIRPVKKQLLTNKMKKKRLQWAKKYKSWTVDQWKKVMFTDESHCLVRGKHSQFVRKSAGEMLTSHHINESVKHPPKKMFWGGFTWKGVGSLVVIEGMMNTDKYIDVLKRRAFPDLKRAFPGENGIFQQDLAPCHSSRKTVKFFQENQVSVLDWPGNSPDLNPIENLWAIVKCRLRKTDCTTSRKLVEAITIFGTMMMRSWRNAKNWWSRCQHVSMTYSKLRGATLNINFNVENVFIAIFAVFVCENFQLQIKKMQLSSAIVMWWFTIFPIKLTGLISCGSFRPS